jgi:preprotein translocase subunit SecF
MQDFYKNNYKKMMLIPLLIAIPLLFMVFVFPGIQPGVDLTGGNVLIVRSDSPISEANLTSTLKENFSLEELKVSTIASPTGFGAWIQYNKDPFVIQVEDILSKANASIDNREESVAFSKEALALLNQPDQNFTNSKTALLAAEQALSGYKEDFSKKLQDTIIEKMSLGGNVEFQQREISPTLGAASFGSSIFITLIGVALIVIVIFVAFRQFIPSAAIIQAMLFDVLMGLAGMALLNIPLSLTTLPALLMLIGYSVDTDIMLTSRMLKGKDASHGERATASMKTGLTMTSTVLAALIVMIIVSFFYQIEIIYQISAILFFGLIGDIIATWLMNAPVLLWWIENKEKAHKKF